MFQAVVGHSDDIETEDAVEEILADCEARLDGLTPQAGLVYCSSEYDHGLMLRRILARFPGLQLIGCTTDGEMSSTGGFTEDAITLALFCSDRIEFAAGVGRGAGSDPMAAAREAVTMARSGLKELPKLALVLPDGMKASAYRVLEGFTAVLGEDVPIVGGMSADRVGGAKRHYRTYQFYNDQVLQDAVPTLLFGGQILYSLGVESGWTPLGERMTVTRAEGEVLYELEGRPAFELYTHYLGDVMNENLAGLGSYPLAIYEPGLDRYYLRVASKVDTGNGAITFLGEIPEGAQVQITQAIRDSIIRGVNASAGRAVEYYPGQSPALAMLFSCTGRKIALGTKTPEEIVHARDGLALTVPMCGFYTFGEIGPVAEHAHARYHNTTFVTLLLGTH